MSTNLKFFSLSTPLLLLELEGQFAIDFKSRKINFPSNTLATWFHPVAFRFLASIVSPKPVTNKLGPDTKGFPSTKSACRLLFNSNLFPFGWDWWSHLWHLPLIYWIILKKKQLLHRRLSTSDRLVALDISNLNLYYLCLIIDETFVRLFRKSSKPNFISSFSPWTLRLLEWWFLALWRVKSWL